jgi:VanZ family protein
MRTIVINGARLVGWLLAMLIVVLSLVPVELRPETGAPHNLEHFSIFFITGIAFGFGYAHRPIVVSVDLIIFAGAVEIAQRFIPGRHARLMDFLIDSVALCIGALGGFIVHGRAFRREVPD